MVCDVMSGSPMKFEATAGDFPSGIAVGKAYGPVDLAGPDQGKVDHSRRPGTGGHPDRFDGGDQIGIFECLGIDPDLDVAI